LYIAVYVFIIIMLFGLTTTRLNKYCYCRLFYFLKMYRKCICEWEEIAVGKPGGCSSYVL